jgi:hypothetical protein
MHRRRDRLVLEVLAVLVLVTVLGPFAVAVSRIIRDPPPEHMDLMILGLAAEAINRLMWSLGVAAVVLVLRLVVAASHPDRTRGRRWTMLPYFLRWGAGEAQGRGIVSVGKEGRTP